jgi:hypothetical protein
MTMSQPNVERVIGQLVTDEGFRRRFEKDPQATIQLVVSEGGLDLTPGERRALAGLDAGLLARFSSAIDPRLQRIDPQGGER